MTPSHMAFSALTSPPCLRSTLRQPAAISTVAVALLAVGTAGAGCGGARSAPATGPPIARQAVIAELQAFGQGLGIARTGNFQRFSDARAAVYRCYFAGQLELPASYETLQLVEPDEPTCPVDETMYDLFFYPIEAVASGSSPVSPALASAALERTLVVVPHEDFHNQPETAQASFDVAEAAATLVGFVAARDFARATYGAESDVALRLDREVDRFLLKSRIVNTYFQRLHDLYSAYDAGDFTREDALTRKAELYADFDRECSASTPAVSFNTCPAVMNNAGLAFDSTYTRHFPVWFELYESLDRDAGAAVALFRRVLATGPQSATDLINATRALQDRTSAANAGMREFPDQ
jgi:hypothetical protein